MDIFQVIKLFKSYFLASNHASSTSNTHQNLVINGTSSRNTVHTLEPTKIKITNQTSSSMKLIIIDLRDKSIKPQNPLPAKSSDSFSSSSFDDVEGGTLTYEKCTLSWSKFWKQVRGDQYLVFNADAYPTPGSGASYKDCVTNIVEKNHDNGAFGVKFIMS
ncbi:MAG: hypothetical protein KIT27_02050 [Legionellales bacterium]|nr:hypothetical protein [Legionellales bacterium]